MSDSRAKNRFAVTITNQASVTITNSTISNHPLAQPDELVRFDSDDPADLARWLREPDDDWAKNHAYVSTYGGKNSRVWDATPGRGWVTIDTVQHWSLHFRGQFIADTSVPEEARLFEDMVELLNRE